jgi:hypothetical protein
MTSTPNLGLPFIEGSQAQKHVTHNEALRILDAAIQIGVLDLTRTSPPSSPAEGERHVVASGATGAWVGQANAIATWQDGAWAFLAARTGWCIWSSADDVMFVFDGTHWRDLRDLPVTLDNAVHIGINTTASAPNLLSVKSNAALLTAINVADGGSGDARLQISKEGAAKTASVFFSDAFSGRAEFGLAGDDNFHLKVSPDGSGWTDALVIDKATGKIALAGFSNAAASRTQLAAAPIDALAFSGMQVNGAMEADQEHAASATTLTATATLSFKYLLDGVLAATRGSYAATAQQVAAPAGMPAAKALKVSVTTAQASLGANDELTIMLPVEGIRSSRLLSGTALASPQSLGFWLSAHRSGAYSGAIINAAKTRSYPFSFTVAAADTPQWISLSGASAIAADTSGTWLNDSNVGMTIAICLAGGSSRLGTAGVWATTASPGLVGAAGTSNGVAATSDVFYLGNVISLPGIELPPSDRAALIMRPLDQELPLCQRYFCSDFASGTAPADNIQKNTNVAMAYGINALISPRLAFPVTMRAAPAVTAFSSTAKASPAAGQWQYYDGTAWNDGTGTSATGIAAGSFQMQLAGTATAQSAYLVAGSWRADARL